MSTRRRLLQEELEKLIADEIADRVCQKIMRDAEERSCDLRYPHWREELHEYMKKRGVTKDRIDSEQAVASYSDDEETL